MPGGLDQSSGEHVNSIPIYLVTKGRRWQFNLLQGAFRPNYVNLKKIFFLSNYKNKLLMLTKESKQDRSLFYMNNYNKHTLEKDV